MQAHLMFNNSLKKIDFSFFPSPKPRAGIHLDCEEFGLTKKNCNSKFYYELRHPQTTNSSEGQLIILRYKDHYGPKYPKSIAMSSNYLTISAKSIFEYNGESIPEKAWHRVQLQVNDFKSKLIKTKVVFPTTHGIATLAFDKASHHEVLYIRRPLIGGTELRFGSFKLTPFSRKEVVQIGEVLHTIFSKSISLQEVNSSNITDQLSVSRCSRGHICNFTHGRFGPAVFEDVMKEIVQSNDDFRKESSRCRTCEGIIYFTIKVKELMLISTYAEQDTGGIVDTQGMERASETGFKCKYKNKASDEDKEGICYQYIYKIRRECLTCKRKEDSGFFSLGCHCGFYNKD